MSYYCIQNKPEWYSKSTVVVQSDNVAKVEMFEVLWMADYKS